MAKIVSAPVDLQNIASILEFEIIPYTFPRSTRGLVIIEDGIKVIGINNKDPIYRQRFTIAHELGHVVNGHQYVEDEYEKGMSRIYTKHFQQEREADMFAGEILMPKDFLISDLNTHGLNEELLRDKYVVSSTALWLRLTTLGLAEKYSAVKW